MKVAIMQPYLFPYIGYYQLARHVDVFVFLDDVSFIKGGYINRNYIKHRGKTLRFTLPVENQSQNRLIKDHLFSTKYKKTIDTIFFNYKKSINFDEVMPLISEIITQSDRNVANLSAKSISSVFAYLGIDRHFLFSSEIDKNNALKGQDRIINICKIIGARNYTNAIGGVDLYSREAFELAGIKLDFLSMGEIVYETHGYPFLPGLSIIDILMLCPPEVIRKLLTNYEIL